MSHQRLPVQGAVLIGSIVAACNSVDGDLPRDGRDATQEEVSATRQPVFVDVAREVGIDFVHRNGAEGRFRLPEIMHGGAAFLDYDNDSRLDVYLVQSGVLPPARNVDHGNRLYRNNGDGRFVDRTEQAGVGDLGHGVGVAVGDYDGDGWVDLYVTNLGPDALYRNLGADSGPGTPVAFEDVTRESGIVGENYSTSAVFFDFDLDGDLDLWVSNYVDASAGKENRCVGANGLPDYCSPTAYRAEADVLYRNDGPGGDGGDGDHRFTDVSEHAGIASAAASGLGVVAADFDGDRLPDVYVANDQMPNQLWINQGDGTFVDEALERGSAHNESGRPEAGMGLGLADLEADGDWDVLSSHLSGETNTLYRNEGRFFRDSTDELGLGIPSVPYTGFGTGFFDYDNDGVLDLFVANGRVNRQDAAALDFGEPNLLLRGLADGRFAPVENAGPALARSDVSRGAAFGDYDGDGDVDLLVANNGGRPQLLRNDAGSTGSWLSVEVRDAGRDRDVVGTTVLAQGMRTQRRLIHSAGSYTAANDPRPHFGFGPGATTLERLIVTWPDGHETVLEAVELNRVLVVRRDGGTAQP